MTRTLKEMEGIFDALRQDEEALPDGALFWEVAEQTLEADQRAVESIVAAVSINALEAIGKRTLVEILEETFIRGVQFGKKLGAATLDES